MAMATAGSSPSSPPPPTSKLHNISFTLTRLTPLYSFNPSRLNHYAREFGDIVRGDVIRGVQINMTVPEKAKSALVRSCEWTIENDLLPTESFDSLVIMVRWDDGSMFTAILLPNFTSPGIISLGKRKRRSSAETGAEFTPLPLLLTRGPQLVMQQLVEYITTRFDSRASELNIPASLLEECLQGYLERLFREDAAPQGVDRGLRILELSFSTPETTNAKVQNALRKIVLTFRSEDVQELYRRSPTILESLNKQILTSTAISLSALTLTRFACAGVLIDSHGKLKIFGNAGIDGTNFIVSKVVAFAAKSG